MRDYCFIGVKTVDDKVIEKPVYLSEREDDALRLKYRFNKEYEVVGQIASVPNWILVRER